MLEVAGDHRGVVVLRHDAVVGGGGGVDLGLVHPDAEALQAVEVVHGLADFEDVVGAVGTLVDRGVLGTELADLIVVVGHVEGGAPGEIAVGDVLGVELEFDTAVVDRTEVARGRGHAGGGGDRDAVEQVGGGLGVPVDGGLDAVVQESEVEGDVGGVGLLPAEAEVAHGTDAVGEHVGVVVLAQGGVGGIGADAVVTGLAVADTELEGVPPVEAGLFEERLVGDHPAGGSGREPAPLVVGAEAGITVAAQRGGDHVAVGVVVLQAAEEGSQV